MSAVLLQLKKGEQKHKTNKIKKKTLPSLLNLWQCATAIRAPHAGGGLGSAPLTE